MANPIKILRLRLAHNEVPKMQIPLLRNKLFFKYLREKCRLIGHNVFFVGAF